MAKYVCSVCGYEYDEATGDPTTALPPAPSGRIFPKISPAPSAAWVKICLKKHKIAA